MHSEDYKTSNRRGERNIEDNVTHHNVTTTRATSHQQNDIYQLNHPNGVYTTSDGVLLVPVQSYEPNGGYIRSPPNKKTRTQPVHTFRSNSSPRSEKALNNTVDKGNKKDLPMWMPHKNPYRDNNTITH
ncbi:hypothetical protein SNE40_014498 [Patella caerulea]|uniref:Uncharacterized protein n=1 Tax=Patella caerulea TaxID=87958 RepID=A0AAN8JIC1_PATCE